MGKGLTAIALDWMKLSTARWEARSEALPASVLEDLPRRFNNNKYSVSASAVGRPVEIQADRAVVRQDGRIVAEHDRVFGLGAIICDSLHNVPVLARKPGALRNGAPFKAWVLPQAI